MLIPSGLSVLAHLVIIGVAKIADLFRTNTQGMVVPLARKERTQNRQRFYYALSFLILTSIFTITLLTLAITLHTVLTLPPPNLHIGEFVTYLQHVEWGMIYAAALIMFGGVLAIISLFWLVQTSQNQPATEAAPIEGELAVE